MRKYAPTVDFVPDPNNTKLEISQIADQLNINIIIYSNDSREIIFASEINMDGTQLNMSYSSEDGYFAYISSAEHFLSTFTCQKCGKWFLTQPLRQRHQETVCKEFQAVGADPDQEPIVKIHFERSRFRAKQSIVDKLVNIGVHVQPADRDLFIIRNFVVYDSESCLVSDLDEIDFSLQTSSYQYHNRHRTIMICAADNILNETRIFEAEHVDDESIFENFVLHLLKLQKHFTELMENRLAKYFVQIHNMINRLENDEYWKKRVENVLRDLESHCSTLNILAYNSR
jgi:hypothetical protein